jgi:hypothetical protein
MGTQGVVLFGTAAALQSPHAKQLLTELKKKNFDVESCSELVPFRERLSSESPPAFAVAVTVRSGGAAMGSWREALDEIPRTPRIILWLADGLESKSFASLQADEVVAVKDGVPALIRRLQSSEVSLGLSLSLSEDDADPMDKTRLVPPPRPAVPKSELSLLSAPEPVEDDPVVQANAENPANLDLDSFLLAPSDVPQENLISQTATVDAELAQPGAEPAAIHLGEMLLGDGGEDQPTQIHGSSEDATQVVAQAALPKPTRPPRPAGRADVASDGAARVAANDGATRVAASDGATLVAVAPEAAPESTRFAGLQELPSVSFTGQGFGGLTSGAGPAAGSGMTDLPLNDEGSETLRRYAALKEREARERENALRVVNGQMAQLKSKLSESESERRRLSMALDESELARRTLEDYKAQVQHHQVRSESAHQEELRAVQARLDNALFQANRSERKLEEFRERVKQDILQIRLRERELANKLELQKRDAEALLSAKDERLMQQKRELDRLEYEVQLLRDRIVEETERAEDRSARLSRALTSLKLAQGMLSGIHEEVIPQADIGPLDPGDGEAA